ncbi:MAG: UvrD-helicase domain-containing protein [Firmicutes bacterium]|nr:UvrD-helicase domain-containing protein [Bacillota bacterium]
MNTPLIAISADFFTAFAALPRQRQSRVLDFMEKFRADPNSPGINYEKIRNAYDPNMRSVRIDDTYRGIVVRQERSGVYLLLWVDHHDRAYQWAERKRCKINPTTGSVQVFDVTEVEVEVRREVPAENLLFSGLSDEQLLKLGIPEEKLGETRAIASLDEFHSMKETFPEDAYERLEWLANGFEFQEVFELFAAEVQADAQAIDPEDFSAALSKPSSQRNFTIVDGEAELQAMMGAPLEKWRVFLHPAQREVVQRDFNGPARVTGGAGTGKTVVAMHRAKRLAGQLPKDGRILFTTFTANLAADIKSNLRKICTLEEFRSIEVTHLDAWVAKCLREAGFDCQLVYGDDLDRLWSEAIALSGEPLDYPVSFFQDEWSQVICAQEILSLKDYVSAARVGRGVRLDRRKRISLWKVFEEYRSLLVERRVRDIETAMNECRQVIAQRQGKPLYSSIIVDEGQDLSVSAYRLLRTMAGEEHKNDLFIVGDAHQRIYRHHASLSSCGINIRGRSSYLRINYRTTEEIRRWSFGLLKGLTFDNLDDGTDDGASCISLTHGTEPVVRDFPTADQEFAFVLERIQDLADQGEAIENICLVGRTNSIVQDYVRRLHSEQIRVYEIRRSKVDDRSQKGVRVATMHRVKGLEFKHVMVVAANRRIVPLQVAIEHDDQVAREAAVKAERCLLYVALTRAKETAAVTSYGGMSEFVRDLLS